MDKRLFFLRYALILMCCLTSSAQAMYWEPYRGHIPNNAFESGFDTNDKRLYLCRARVHGSLQPGKTWAGYGKCNIAYGGKELMSNHFSILRQERRQKPLYWSRSLDNKPLAVGRDTNGKRLFLCRANYRGSQQPGKTWRGYGHCNISYGGSEIVLDNYRVLSQKRGVNDHAGRGKRGRECISDAFGHQACGYHCVKQFNRVACAASPAQRCVISDFGKVACGYNCVRTASTVACASTKHANCVVSPFGQARCGRNCRIDGLNHISCG